MRAATLFVHKVYIFRGFRKNILGNEVLKLHWTLNFIWEIDISGWLSSLQFFSVTLPVMGIKPCLFYRVVKNLGRPRPLIMTLQKYIDCLKKRSSPESSGQLQPNKKLIKSNKYQNKPWKKIVGVAGSCAEVFEGLFK